MLTCSLLAPPAAAGVAGIESLLPAPPAGAAGLALPGVADGFSAAMPMPAPRVRGGLPMASATGLNMAQLPSGPGGMTEIISTIDNLIGDNGAAIRLLEQLVNRGRGTGTGQETIRIGLASAAAGGGAPGPIVGGFSINRDGLVGRHGDLASLLEGRPGAAAHRESASSKNEFVPMPTMQRWLDEERITQGRFSTQRIADLTVHVVNALLPAAREAVRKAKEAEAAEEEKRQAQAKEDAAKAVADAKAPVEAEAAAPAATSSVNAPASVAASDAPAPTETSEAAPASATADVQMSEPSEEGACPLLLARRAVLVVR